MAKQKTFNMAECQILDAWPINVDKATSAKGVVRNVAIKSDGFDNPGGAAIYGGATRFKGPDALAAAKEMAKHGQFFAVWAYRPDGKGK